MGSIGEIVLDGNFALALPIALLAGLVSFASPCVLPLVPGYLGYVGGFAGDGEKQDRRRLLLGVSLFILGFSLVFVATGVLFGAAGLLLRSWLDIITPIAGVVIIVMGLVFVGQFTFLQRSFKPQWKVATGLAGAPLLGIVFAIG
ncbi:MAG: cytochrome c biogenesis protein CcdA, partial [Glaciihabitans sp.]